MTNGVRQDTFGWLWVGIGALATLALPVWTLFTAVILQLSPEVVATSTDPSVVIVGEPESTFSDSMGLLWHGATSAARTLAWGILPASLIGVGAIVGSMVRARRDRAEREELDQALSGDAVLSEGAVDVAETALSPLEPEVGGTEPTLRAPTGTLIADPWRRVGAWLIDTGLFELTLLPAQIAYVRSVQRRVEDVAADPSMIGTPDGSLIELMQTGLLITMPLVLALAVVQLVLLARGLTVGKWRLGLRITDTDGVPAGLERSVLLRMVVFAILFGIPVIGWLVIPLVDVSLLFGEDRRSLKDLVAGTLVVDDRGQVSTEG